MPVPPVPADYPRVAPHLAVDGAAAAIDFYVSALGARPRGGRMTLPDGRIAHAELMLGDALVMLADADAGSGFPGPDDVGGTPVTLHLYVEDVDAVFAAAIEAGARRLAPVATRFYGDRSGLLRDPWGHRWNVATHVEDVPEAEMDRRRREQFGGA